jgi:phasin family protein
MPTKSSKTAEFVDLSQRAFAPATRLNQVLAANFERVARFQYELAGDCMLFAIEQMNATAKAKDVPTLLAKQREIATKFAEKASTRQQALSTLVTESQADVAEWFEESAAAATKAA